MECEVIFQMMFFGENLLANWTAYWVRVFLMSMPGEFLSSLANKLTLITVDHLMACLVSRQLALGFDLFVTNITDLQPLNFSRVFDLDVEANMTYSFGTFYTVEHILEMNSHVQHQIPSCFVLVITESTAQIILDPL